MNIEGIREHAGLAAATVVALVGGVALCPQPAEAAPETVAVQSSDMAYGDPDHDGVPNMFDVHPGQNDALFHTNNNMLPDWKDRTYQTPFDSDRDGTVNRYDSLPTIPNSLAVPLTTRLSPDVKKFSLHVDPDQDGIVTMYDSFPTRKTNDRDLDGTPDAADPAPNDPQKPDPQGYARSENSTNPVVQAAFVAHERALEQAAAFRSH